MTNYLRGKCYYANDTSKIVLDTNEFPRSMAFRSMNGSRLLILVLKIV